MMKQIAAFALLAVSAAAQLTAPDRKVTHNVVVSDHDPKVRIELPAVVHYLGADRWPLYKIADAELHAFIEPDAKHNVERLYWVQFEQYLASRPDLHYTYDSPQHTTIGGWDWFVDFWPRSNDEEVTPSSDREHIEAMIKTKGYSMPSSMIYVRLVHLLNAEKRKELMIIYGEDLAPTGMAAADLKQGGKSYQSWPDIKKGLLERAKEKIKVEPGQ